MKEIYFNDVQLVTFLIGANTNCIIAGRRTGKTDSIASPFLLRNMQRMPGSTNGIVVPTFKHGLTNTIPGLLTAWRRWGFIDGVHFVVGRKPPKSFAPAITEPSDFEHVISFYNGSRAVIISQDRPGSSNSLTLSSVLVDEARFVDRQKLMEETLPANGGSKAHFGKHSYNHALMFLSDMPQTQKGSWLFAYKDKMDPDLIEAIEGLVYEIWKVNKRIEEDNKAGRMLPVTLQTYRRTLDRRLNQFRSVATYYKEYSSIENLQLLGEKYIADMKRDLTPLTFRTSILCQRVGISQDGFYNSMTDAHSYDASDMSVLDSIWDRFAINGRRPTVFDSTSDADVNPDQPICIGMDYNANINWIVAGQPCGDRLNVIKSFYVKFTQKIPELIDEFCRYYFNHRCKKVIFYYDSTALGSNYAVNDQDFKWHIVTRFQRNGWTVEDVYLGNPMRHDEKYLLINNGFKGNNNLEPFFNRQNNEDLLLALQAAGIQKGRNGFRKYKAGEKLAETEEDLLEHRTDGTDAFDTLYIGCEKFPRMASMFSFSGTL